MYTQMHVTPQTHINILPLLNIFSGNHIRSTIYVLWKKLPFRYKFNIISKIDLMIIINGECFGTPIVWNMMI